MLKQKPGSGRKPRNADEWLIFCHRGVSYLVNLHHLFVIAAVRVFWLTVNLNRLPYSIIKPLDFFMRELMVLARLSGKLARLKTFIAHLLERWIPHKT